MGQSGEAFEQKFVWMGEIDLGRLECRVQRGSRGDAKLYRRRAQSLPLWCVGSKQATHGTMGTAELT